MRRSYRVVAQQHGLKAQIRPPAEAGPGAAVNLGADMVRSVLELLQGKTSLSMNLEVAGGDATAAQGGVMDQLLHSLGLGRGDTRSTTFGRCRLKPADDN